VKRVGVLALREATARPRESRVSLSRDKTIGNFQLYCSIASLFLLFILKLVEIDVGAPLVGQHICDKSLLSLQRY
jgi:hypothetical protein